MAKMQKIIVLTNSDRDEHRKFYTVDTPLIDQAYAIFRQPVAPEDGQLFDQVGEPGGDIALALMKIDGVEAVKLEKEAIKVTSSISWKELQPKIFGILEEHLGKLEVATGYPSMTQTALKVGA